MQWLSKLVPKQKMQDVGQGSIQIGCVGGNFSNTQNNSSQTVYIFVNHEQQAHAPLQPQPDRPPVVDPVPEPAIAIQAAAIPSLSEDQAYILKVMRHEEELGALAERFMKKQFQTTYVKGLSSHQARRVVLYIYKCAENKNAARQNINA